jgi:hypothetical protein
MLIIYTTFATKYQKSLCYTQKARGLQPNHTKLWTLFLNAFTR